MRIIKGAALIRGRLFETWHLLVEIWYSLIMSKQFFFLKKAASHVTLSFLLSIDRYKMKNVQPLLIFFAGDGFLLFLSLSLCVSLYAFMKHIFLTKEDILLHIRFLELVHSEGKITQVCFSTQITQWKKEKCLSSWLQLTLIFCKIQV